MKKKKENRKLNQQYRNYSHKRKQSTNQIVFRLNIKQFNASFYVFGTVYENYNLPHCRACKLFCDAHAQEKTFQGQFVLFLIFLVGTQLDRADLMISFEHLQHVQSLVILNDVFFLKTIVEQTQLHDINALFFKILAPTQKFTLVFTCLALKKGLLINEKLY